MATKKSASSAKKTGAKAKAVKTTKVTTVKAVEAGDSRRRGIALANGGGLLRTPVTAAALAEFVGAFLLATTILIIRNEPFYLFIGLIGIVMMIGGLSGAHLNPAITIGAWVTKRVNWIRAVSYMIAQFLGAMLALVVMDAFLKQAPEVSAEAMQFGQSAPELFSALGLPEGKETTLMFIELIGVVILGFAYATILRPGMKDRVRGAFTVGGGAFLAMAFASTAASYIGASAVLNPAIAVTLKAIDFAEVWSLVVYALGAIFGAIIGFFLHDLLRSAETAEK